VLHVVLNLHHGGLERVLGDLARGVDASRFEQHILALEFLGDLSRGLEEHARLRVAHPQRRWSLIRPVELARDIRAVGPQVVHSHSGVWFKASRAARMAGVGFVVHTDHGRQSPDPLRHRLFDGLASRRTDAIIAVSEVLGRQLAATVVHDPSRIHVIPNGIDTGRFRKQTSGGIHAELGVDGAVPVIGSIGRLDPIKRFDVMLEAFAMLLKSGDWNPAPLLVIAGDGPERERLETLAISLGLKGRVHLLGWRDDVHALHATFTIFTMSSRSEGTSIGLLEAMSAELCPVVTDVGGNGAVLGDALRHRLVPAERADLLALAWREALRDRGRLASDGVAARRRVEESFSLARMARAHERLYETGVRRNSSAPSMSPRIDAPTS
jgi:glycosyltransferase involved in cell wall biosynthesis